MSKVSGNYQHLSEEQLEYLQEKVLRASREIHKVSVEKLAKVAQDYGLSTGSSQLSKLAAGTYDYKPSNQLLFTVAVLSKTPYEELFRAVGRPVPDSVTRGGDRPVEPIYTPENDDFLRDNPLPPYRASELQEVSRVDEMNELNKRLNEPLIVFIDLGLRKINGNLREYRDALDRIGVTVSAATISQLYAGKYGGVPKDHILHGIAELADLEPSIVFNAVQREVPKGNRIHNFPRDFNRLSLDDRATLVRIFDAMTIAAAKVEWSKPVT